MAFKFKRDRGGEEVEIKAEDIIGMTQEQLNEKFGSIDGLRTALTEQGATLEGYKAALEAINNKLAESSRPRGGNNNGEGGGGEEEVDPTVRLSTSAIQLGMENKIENIKRKLRDKVDPNTGQLKYQYWDIFEADMEKLTEKDPLASKCSETYWANAYDIIVGRNVEKIQKGEIKTRRSFFMEPGGANPGGQQKPDKNTPSEIDIQQAKKFNISVDKYMETKSKMTFVS